jgi:hypothetical protein
MFGWRKKRQEQDTDLEVQVMITTVMAAGVQTMDETAFEMDVFGWAVKVLRGDIEIPQGPQSPAGDHVRNGFTYLRAAAVATMNHWDTLHLTPKDIPGLIDADRLPVPDSAKVLIGVMISEFRAARALIAVAA